MRLPGRQTRSSSENNPVTLPPPAGRHPGAPARRDLHHALRRQLARIRRDDYATTFEEMSLGACSVAVPIRSHDQVVAALGVVVPS